MFNNVLHRNRATDEPVVGEGRDADGQVAAERVPNKSTVDSPVAESTVDSPVAAAPVADRALVGRTPVVERTVSQRPVGTVAEPVVEAAAVDERQRWAHNSFAAVLGLVVGVVAVGAVATGLLAPLGVAAGVIGVLISLTGLVRASRRGVTGHGAALVGLLTSLAAVILGVLAIQGALPWLNSDTDQVARLHTWMHTTFPWMKHW